VPYNTYGTKDGYIIIACIGDEFFERFIKVIDRPELQKPEYRQQPVRHADRDRIDAIINEELAKETSGYWLEKLTAGKIPCGPVNDFAQALSDPQVLARNMVVDVPLAGGSSVRMPGNPMKFSSASEPAATPPPRLGEHTEAVLSELGYSGDRLRVLAQAGVIG
jgi:crotonobetainyl-CoA:carnitine CoA-transferase CaiB-like acyl-CoA transferase